MSNINIETRTENKRGCGYRKGGGKYMVSFGIPRGCGKLPIELTRCPCCDAGIKPSRGWTWIDGDAIIGSKECRFHKDPGARIDCSDCPLSRTVGRVGLLWIGEKFYPTPADWTREALQMGVSRRVSAIPKDFKVGETIVFVAHRKAIQKSLVVGEEPEFIPGIFHVFTPTAIEYVVKGDETDEELERLTDRGFKLIKVIPNEEQTEPLDQGA